MPQRQAARAPWPAQAGVTRSADKAAAVERRLPNDGVYAETSSSTAEASKNAGPDGMSAVPSRMPSGMTPPPASVDILGTYSIQQLRAEFEEERSNIALNCTAEEQQVKDKRMHKMEKPSAVQDFKNVEKPEYMKKMPYHPYMCNVVESARFQNFYFSSVALYAICMGFELELDDDKYATRWVYLNCLFAMTFSVEVVCKLYAYGHSYFKITWFVLEFCTTGGAMLTLGMHYYNMSEGYKKTFTCIKLSRIVLLGKLLSIRPEFRVIVVGFTRSLKALYGVCFVVAVICYACTLFVYSVIGKHDYSNTRWAEDHEAYFGGIMRTMMTLFSMIIVDEWAGYARPVYFEQTPVVFFFFFFSVILTLGLLNVVTGMVVDTVNSIERDEAEAKRNASQAMQRGMVEAAVDLVFEEGDGQEITELEFTDTDVAELRDMVDVVDLPHNFSLKDLFTVLDKTGHRTVDRSQFIDGIICLTHGNHFQQHCQVVLSLNKVWRDTVALRKELRAMHHYMLQQFPALAEAHALVDLNTAVLAKAAINKKEGTTDRGLLEDRHFTVEDLVNELETEKQAIKLPKVGASQKRMVPQKELPPPKYLERLPCQRRIKGIVESPFFQGFFFALVAVYSLVMGAELSYDSDEASDNWFALNVLFTMVFDFEALMKLYSYGHRYFRVIWFDIEFMTCAASMITLAMHYKGYATTYQRAFTVMKLSRIVLLGKLFSMREEFETIVVAFTRAIMSLWSIMFVLIVINYGCTLFCFSVIGKHDYSEYTGYDHDLYWGNIPRTMITMFSMMITDNWGGYSRTVWEEQPPVILFFYLYTLLLTWGLLNVVTGMIVETVNRVRTEHDQEVKDRQIKLIKAKLFELVDIVFHAGDGHEISEEEFVGQASQPELIDMLEHIDFPHTFTLRDFFIVLDQLGQKQMTREQFVDSMLALMNGTNFHRDCQILLSIHRNRRGVVDLRKEMRTIHHCMRLAGAGAFATAADSAHQGTLSGMAPAIRRVDSSKDSTAIVPTVRSESGQLVLEPPQGNSSNPWEQLLTTLQVAATKHAKEELQKRWEELEWEYKTMDPTKRRKHCVMPSISGRVDRSRFAALEEQYFVWNKLSSAISRESLHDLRLALDHARDAGLTETSRAILFTYCDALTRHHECNGFTLTEVLDAISRGAFEYAISMVLEMAIAQGAQRHLLLNAMARLCGPDSNARAFLANLLAVPSELSRARSTQAQLAIAAAPYDPRAAGDGAISSAVATVDNREGKDEPVGNLITILRVKASQHSRQELNKSWEDLDSAYAVPDAVLGGGGPRGGPLGPGHSPFSGQEEHFFIRNQLVNAIHRESLSEIRRALSYAEAFGVDPKTIEIEAAYRDALLKQEQVETFSLHNVKEVLRNGNWWSALDVIIGAALARGCDRSMLLKMIGKVCLTSRFSVSMPTKLTGSM